MNTSGKEGDFIELDFEPIDDKKLQIERSEELYSELNKRRSVRDFSSVDFPIEILENAILTAGTAPSGAHLQPWRFVVVRDSKIKRKIRIAAEKEEAASYRGRMSKKWLRRLAPLGTNESKPFLDVAPYLIVVFRINSIEENGEMEPTYYSQESVGIAVGMLIAALHHAGLVTLTHTPSPMRFLQEILGRPKNEIPFVLLPVGYPAEGAMVPNLKRKNLDQIMTIF